MCKFLLSFLLSVFVTPVFSANYFVGPYGSDSNTGTMPDKPFASLQLAANTAKPGDTVFIMSGIYTNSLNAPAILEISKSGEENKWIVYTNYPGHNPKLIFNCWEAISIKGASYIEIKGLEIEGNAQNISLEYALAEMNNLLNPATSGNGIFIKDDTLHKKTSHHVRIINNKVYNCPGGGIGAIYSDYITITGNLVYNCGFYAPYANSGISVYQAKAVDEFEGYKITITNNVSHSNYNYVPFYYSNVNEPSKREFTDGNGIIIDDLLGTQAFVGKAQHKPYMGKCLVSNNIVYNNGGSGIHVYLSANVDIINNTAFKNGRHEKMNPGQIFAIRGKNVHIINNIMYAIPGKKVNNDWENENVQLSNNLFYDETESPVIAVKGKNSIIADPQFVNPSTENPDFRLKPGSPCINRGVTAEGRIIDLGAIQYSGK